MELKDRIREAMEAAKLTPAGLATATKKTKGAVTQWLDGTTKSLKAETADKLQTATGYRASWIISGKGEKLVDTGITETVNHPSHVSVPTLADALPVVLAAMAAVRSRAELRQLLPMLVDTNAEAYRTRLLELLQEAASNQPQEQEARVNPAYQDLIDAEVRLAEERRQNEKKHGRQPPAAHAA